MPIVDEPLLGPPDEWGPSRYRSDREVEDLGWGRVSRKTTVDRNTGDVTERVMTLDLFPDSGVQLEQLEMLVGLMGVDHVVARLMHCDELAAALKKRRKNLLARLEEICAGADQVIGQHYEAGWKNERALCWGRRQDEEAAAQRRLREESDRV